MRLVDVRTMENKVNAIYLQIPQPMAIYYNVEEFKQNEPDATVVTNILELTDALNKFNKPIIYNSSNRYVSCTDINLWVKTVDEYVPDYAEVNGTIYYVKNGNDFIKTDGVFTRIHYFTPTPSKIILYTSSGINSVGIGKWDITGAVRKTFLQEKDARVGDKVARQEAYKKYLEKLTERKTPSVQLTRALSMLFNPLSQNFLNIDGVFNKHFPRVRKPDRGAIMNSMAFREALMQTFTSLVPDLKKKLIEKIPPEQVSEWMIKMVEVSLEKESSEEQRKAIQFVVDAAYQETTTVNSGVPMLNASQEHGAIGAPKQVEERKPKLEDMTDEISGDELDEEELKQRKKDADYPDSFVMPDLDELPDL